MAKMQQPKPKVAPKPVVKQKPAPKKGEPTYDRLPLSVSLEEEERTGYRKEGIKPTKQDSAAYKQGYNRGKRGEKAYPGESPVARGGRWEGQNEKPTVKKKLQTGGTVTPTLRKGQYKRLGRLEGKNPNRAESVSNRMIERDTRLERGKSFVANKLAKAKALVSKPAMKTGGKVSAKKK